MERHHVSLMVVMFLVVLCVSQCIAQVNFSPNWGGGKRSADPPDECRSSMDSLKYIYKLIQSEAQKLYECEKFNQ
ncbi:hypertrehalosaemic prohormone-like isoform X2 [Diaphorina citri]|uniref:AKH n=1 Tax=Diaphorina citri TaxID=121845 RepID=A0A1S3DUP8_DIACI|nr:hypertrehalosaemic prohormone-like isoform X2 [Diaphorina citri]AWT50584.1 AKH [Diaphorina citri]